MLMILTANVCIIIKMQRRNDSDVIRRQSASAMEAQRSKEKKVTVMLLIITFVFLLLLLPFFVCHMYRYFVLSSRDDTETREVLFLAWNVSQRLWYTNNAVNFYVYALFGTEFRKELVQLFKSIFK
ncbi:MAG: G-protein coupled receptor [Deltaproteobacteria bacterium]|nr:G-protein coupled receptor [Deltaproteobacteria bacterium]